MDLNDLLSGLMTEVKKVSNTASMIGEPLQIGGSHMVPLLRLTMGFGTGLTSASGSGDEKSDGRVEGGGAGGGMLVEPRAFVVVGADGIPHMVALKNGKQGVIQKALELKPTEPEKKLPLGLIHQENTFDVGVGHADRFVCLCAVGWACLPMAWCVFV